MSYKQTISNFCIFGVDRVEIYLSKTPNDHYTAMLGIYLDTSDEDNVEHITLITEIEDEDKFRCVLSSYQLAMLLFGDVMSVYNYEDGQEIEKFSATACAEFIHPHLRQSSTIH